MAKSLPSSRITLGDVPEVRDFRAEFVYEFFVTNEQDSVGTAGIPESELLRPAETFDAARIDRLSGRVPRFVKFSFIPVTIQDQGPNEFVTNPDPSGHGSSFRIADHLNDIQSETDFSNRKFMGVNFQDDNVDRKLSVIVSGSIAKRATAHNRLKERQIEQQRESIMDSIIGEHSLLDAAKALIDQTAGEVTDNFVVNALNNIETLRLQFIDEEGEKELADQAFERVKNVSVSGQFNRKIVGTVIENAVNDPMSTFSDELAPLQELARLRQEAAIASDDPNVFKRNDYDTLFQAIRTEPIDAPSFVASVRLVGYIIDKHELSPGGAPIRRESIIIENPFASTAVDLRVAYGRIYVYTIRAIVEIKVSVSVNDSDERVVALGLVSSRNSQRVTVACVERVPPPPPADFNIFWNYMESSPTLSWNFPTNPQRDIKKFQVFRRRTVNEPFQMIREFNFDDSRIVTPNPETPDPALVEFSTVPVLRFRDEEFTKDSRFIYAVCSVDAHAFTSNYSLQMEASFDRFTNQIVKKLVSFAGAPKSYPNLKLAEDLFVDTIKSSGHTRVRVFFDPEFLEVTDAKGADLQLLARDVHERGKYRLQIINTDVQKQEVVDILIEDVVHTQGGEPLTT